jgi:bacterioferritin (cytochrome b1)
MSTAPVVVIDTLNSLLEAELNSVFRFMGEGSPYLGRASAEVRRPLQEMVETNERHVNALAEMINQLGGNPVPRSIAREEQYLAFLSLKFLLPKLVEAKMLLMRRYETAQRTIEKVAPREVMDLLRRQFAEHQEQLAALEKAAAHVAATPSK